MKATIIRAIVALLLGAGITSQAQWKFNALKDPSGPASTQPQGVYGENIVGLYYDSQNHANGFLYNGSTYTTLDYPGAAETFVGAIDGSNIVGTYRTIAGNGFSSHGFLYNGSTWTTLNDPAGILTLAYAISGNYVVGLYDTSGNQDAWGYVYSISNGTYYTINDPTSAHGAYQGTYPEGIDGANIVGSYADSGGHSHGFMYTMVSSNYTILDCPLGPNGTLLRGISGSQITGAFYDANNVQHGLLYNGTTWAVVDVPDAAQSGLAGICGQVAVGGYSSNGNSYGFSAAPVAAAIIITNLPIPTGLGGLALNPTLNRFYLSGQGAQPVQIDGATFAQTSMGASGGDGVDVDLANNNLWEAGLYAGNVTVWNGSDAPVTTISLGDCPTGVNVDSVNRRAWVSAQCGGGNDPVWVIDTDTFSILDGPIGSGGIQGPTIVNPATGRFYLAPSGVSKRVNPSTYALTANNFGTVTGVNPGANLLYAETNNGGTLQIINGAPNPEVVLTNISLGFAIGGNIGANPDVGRIYLGAGSSNFIAVLNATNGAPLERIILGTNVVGVQSIAVDNGRGLVYAIGNVSGSLRLFVIQDAAVPAVVSAPINTTVATGGTATLSVVADGYPLLYQWALNGTNIPGATGATLTIQNASAANAGLYTVTISNGYGAKTTQAVSLSLVDLRMFAGLIVDGPAGAQYGIQSTPTVGSPNWTTLTNITLGAQPYTFIDYNSPYAPKQFYRAVPLAP